MIYKLTGITKDNIWGGEKLAKSWNKKASTPIIGESWDLSLHSDGLCVIAAGERKGETLKSVLTNADLGQSAIELGYSVDSFPIIIKFIDAKDDLSVQVHPERGASWQGKSEMWYVAGCDEGAKLYIGFKRQITKDELVAHIRNKTLLSVLNEVPVKKGDSFFIPARTVHSIGKGNVICEVQQNANITYRLYDYDRKDASGNTRQLHVEQAVDVVNLSEYTPFHPQRVSDEIKKIADCDFFIVDEYTSGGRITIPTQPRSFIAINFIAGSGVIDGIPYNKGDAAIVTANSPCFDITGQCVFLLTRMP